MLLGITLFLLLCTVLVWFFCVRHLCQKRLFAAIKMGIGGVLLTAITVLLLTIVYGVYALKALEYRQPVATLTVKQLSAHQFRVTVASPNTKQTKRYQLDGDQWLLGAQVVVWQPWLQRLGVRNQYQLAFLTSRYTNGHPGKTDYSLGPINQQAGVHWVYHAILRHVAIETIEGSAVYMPLQGQARYRVLLTPSGLMAKRIPL